jgi:signal transduction histidine kinase/DNA-binding response OmpR family regulator
MNDNSLAILLIEDNPEHAHIISRYIRSADSFPAKLTHEDSLAGGLHHLKQSRFDAILLDLRLPDSDIGQTLPKAMRVCQEVPIIVLSSIEDRDLAIQTVHQGAQDYLCKTNLSSELIVRAIYSAIERKQTEARIRTQIEQKQALFDLGQYALLERNMSRLMGKTMSLVTKTLNTDLACIWEKKIDSPFLEMKVGHGWQDGWVGHARIPLSSAIAAHRLSNASSQESCPIPANESTVVFNLIGNTFDQNLTYLQTHHATSGMSTFIRGHDDSQSYGLLETFTRQQRIFSNDEAALLQGIANILAAALQRNQLEEELRQKIEDLNAAHRRKDEFLATLSHELRTPLNVVSGYVELLRLPDNPPNFLEEALTIIDRNLKSEIQLVCNTLDVAQIITGKMTLKTSPLPFDSTVESAMDSIRLSAQNKKIQIESHFETGTAQFLGDATRMQQLTWNLLTNAVKFTPKEGHIIVRTRIAGSMVELSVEDSGIGIAKENLSHVFERFWQEDSGLNRHYMGLGLGLGIVRHIAELHGGSVFVESQGKNKGTKFTVQIPIYSPKTQEILI